MKLIRIQRNIVCSQSKGCLLFLQVGTSALIVRHPFAKPNTRDVAVCHAEIDTPVRRLRVSFNLWRRKQSRKYVHFGFGLKEPSRHGGYRNRWLKKLGYIA